MRLKVFRFIIILGFLFILSGVFYTQIIKGNFYRRLSTHNRIRVVPLEGQRGLIKDRNGTILADTRSAYHVMLIPQDLEEKSLVFSYLSDVLKIDAAVLERRYRQKKLNPFSPVTIAEDIEKEQAILLDESAYLYPGLLIGEGFKRYYPLEKNSAHVLGYVGRANLSEIENLKEYGYSPQTVIGKTGIEKFYDLYLKGVEGGMQIEVNSRGRQVRLLGIKEPVQGEDITLTIDHNIQSIADEFLIDHRGAVVIMDSDNGEILAMTSSPTFDPNHFVDARGKSFRGEYFTDEDAPLLNRAVKGQFPPGSVLKPVIALAALDEKKISTQTSYECPGYYELGNRRFRCTHRHGPQNLIEAIAHSCNVYFYRLGLSLGVERMHKYSKMFGLGELTHVDLPYEKKGFLPSVRKKHPRLKDKWYKGDFLNYAIGQGNTLTTPLQLTTMMNIFARQGIVVHPHLIKKIGNEDVDKFVEEKRLQLPQKHFEEVRKSLRAVVGDFTGTANVLDIPGLSIAGKTGTAQSSGEKEDHSWFVGYARGQKNVTFCVFLEHGGSSFNAVVISRKILMKMKRQKMI